MIQYPISIDSSGGLALSIDPEVDNVRALIDTRFYERCMFPNYGISLDEFDPVSSNDLAVMMMALKLSIDLWHDFISDIRVDSDSVELGNLGLVINIQGREVVL